MEASRRVRDGELERHGRRMTPPALRLILIGAVVMTPGILLVILSSQALLGFGIALILIGSCPIGIAIAMLFSAGVARWAARHRLFA